MPLNYHIDGEIVLVTATGKIGSQEALQVRKEMEVKQHAREEARRICAGRFDANVTLKVFQKFRTDSEFNAAYTAAIGNDPFRRKNQKQARINRSLGGIIKHAVGGEAETTAQGHRINASVDAEYIKSYTPLRPRTQAVTEK